jgi:hypothetical protein
MLVINHLQQPVKIGEIQRDVSALFPGETFPINFPGVGGVFRNFKVGLFLATKGEVEW